MFIAESYREGLMDLHMVFTDLEKAYDKVFGELIWSVLEKKGVKVRYIEVIKDMYDRASMLVRTTTKEMQDT